MDPSELEPNYMFEDSTWQKVHCENFLDSSGTRSFIERALWIPRANQGKAWGTYCLLRRKLETASASQKFDAEASLEYDETKDEL